MMLAIGKILYKTVLLSWVVNVSVSTTTVGIAAEDKLKVIEAHKQTITQLVQSAEVQQCLDSEKNSSDSLRTILAIDKAWPAQTEYVHRVIEHPCTEVFKQLLANSAYHFSEIMLTNQWGALVAAYPLPSDYWQGDEQKFIQPAVTGEIYISPESWDASTGTFSFFIAVPVFYSQYFAGVLISGINVTAEYLDKLSMQELLIIEVKPEAERPPSHP